LSGLSSPYYYGAIERPAGYKISKLMLTLLRKPLFRGMEGVSNYLIFAAFRKQAE